MRSACAAMLLDQSLLVTLWVAKDPNLLQMDSEDWSDWMDAQADLSVAGHTDHLLGFVML